MLDDVKKMTARAALDGMEKGVFSSRALTRAMLDEIGARDNGRGAYAFVDGDAALDMADAADARRARGETGALLGVPVALQDDISAAGQPCECGSKMLAGFRALHDAAMVGRLKSAGAVLLGRTRMDEFGLGPDVGAATAVAGGLALAAIATDTGGFPRLAAARRGCVALRPTYGRVPRHGALSVASSMDQAAVLAKDARDAALLLNAIAGRDGRDAMTLDAAPVDRAAPGRGVKGLRVGVAREWRDAGVAAAAGRLGDAGAEIVEVRMPRAECAEAVYRVCMSAEAASSLARFDGVRQGFRARDARDVDGMYVMSRSQGMGLEVKKWIILGTAMTGRDFAGDFYFRALKVRALIRDDFTRAFESCGVLLAPCGAGGDAAPPCLAASLAGVCALSSGGLQLIGPVLGEENLLRTEPFL